MRFVPSLLLMLCLAACQRGGQNEAIRQGVLDHLAQSQMNVAGMDIAVASVKINGEQADATVNFTVKGQTGGAPMAIPYHLQRQNSKWVVVGSPNAGGHGGTADPNAGTANPHGGAMPPGGGDSPHGSMPSPKDLPPTKK